MPALSASLGTLSVNGSLLLLVLGATPSFSEAWYQEHMVGDLPQAYQLYQRIYLNTEHPIEVRRRAAIRAGGCAEKRGETEQAIRAYKWLEEHAGADETLMNRARVRLSKLSGAGPSDDNDSPALDSLATRRQEALGSLRGAFRAQRLRRERIERIERRLRSLGVELDWPQERFPESDSRAVTALEFVESLDLTVADEALLRNRLSHRFHLVGLQALRAQDLYSADRAFSLQLALSEAEDSEHRHRARALEFRRVIAQILALSEGLGEMAEQRIAEERAFRRAEVSLGMRVVLEEARVRLSDDDNSEALELLAEVSLQRAWAEPGVRDGASVRELDRQALREREGQVVTRADAKLRDARQSVSTIALLAEEILWSSPLPGGKLQPKLESPNTMDRLKSEIEETLELIDEPAPGDPEISPDESEALRLRVSDTLLILEWFGAELDPTEQFERSLRRYLR